MELGAYRWLEVGPNVFLDHFQLWKSNVVESSGSDGCVSVKPETNFLAGNPIMTRGGISPGDSGNFLRPSWMMRCLYFCFLLMQLKQSVICSCHSSYLLLFASHCGNKDSPNQTRSFHRGRWTTSNHMLLMQNGWCKGVCVCLINVNSLLCGFNFGKWTQFLYSN